MIEELNPEDETKVLGTWFVKNDGYRDLNITSIGRVSGGIIRGLTNDHIYRVTSAKPLTGTLTYHEESNSTSISIGNAKNIPITNQKIELNPPEDTKKYFLNFAAGLDTANFSYDVWRVPVVLNGVPNNGPAVKITPITSSITDGVIVELLEQNNTVDYVFIDGIKPNSFKYLRVISLSNIQLEISIITGWTADGSPILSGIPTTSLSSAVLQNNLMSGSPSSLIITINNASTLSNIVVKHNNTPVTGTLSGITFTMPFNAANIWSLAVGTHFYTVEGINAGGKYSTEFSIIISP